MLPGKCPSALLLLCCFFRPALVLLLACTPPCFCLVMRVLLVFMPPCFCLVMCVLADKQLAMLRSSKFYGDKGGSAGSCPSSSSFTSAVLERSTSRTEQQRATQSTSGAAPAHDSPVRDAAATTATGAFFMVILEISHLCHGQLDASKCC